MTEKKLKPEVYEAARKIDSEITFLRNRLHSGNSRNKFFEDSLEFWMKKYNEIVANPENYIYE